MVEDRSTDSLATEGSVLHALAQNGLNEEVFVSDLWPMRLELASLLVLLLALVLIAATSSELRESELRGLVVFPGVGRRDRLQVGEFAITGLR